MTKIYPNWYKLERQAMIKDLEDRKISYDHFKLKLAEMERVVVEYFTKPEYDNFGE